METIEKRITKEGNSYWGGNGAYQKEYDSLWVELVPSQGEAKTVHGELIRSLGRLQHDYCNNGNCNIRNIETYTEYYACHSCDGEGDNGDVDDDGNEVMEMCEECWGSGEIGEEYNGDITIDEYYQKMIDFIHYNISDKVVADDLEIFLKRKDIGYSTYTFNDDEMKIYNNLFDAVMYEILTTENKDRTDI
jgi:hypothetical protein